MTPVICYANNNPFKSLYLNSTAAYLKEKVGFYLENVEQISDWIVYKL